MNTIFTARCPFCGKISRIPCDENALAQYNNGALIQDAFPNMPAHERETIISGMCLDCQTSFFEEDDDDCDGECDVCCDFDCPSNANYFAPQDDFYDGCFECDDIECPKRKVD